MTTPSRALTIELARVAVAAIGIVVPFAIGAWLGDVPHTQRLEPRYAYVIASACLVTLAVWAESAALRWRQAGVLAGLVPLLHVTLQRSPTIVALDACVLLAAALGVAVRATRRVFRLDRSLARTASVVLLVATVPGPLFTLGWGLVSTTVAPAATRLFHSSPVTNEHERAVSFPSLDGTVLHGTYARGRAGAPAVLLVHGLGDSRRRLVPWATELERHGAHVLRFDLRSHGISEGVAVTFADREPDDVESALRWLGSQPDTGPLHVLGVSMGGGASLAAISRPNVRALSTVELAPASSFRLIVDARLPQVPLLHFLATSCVYGVSHGLGHRAPLELVPAADVARAGPARILVVHSRSDTTVDPSVTEALVRRAPWVEVTWIDGVSHVDTPRHALEDDALRARILRFLDVD
jgi:pimeloyl-ACP methyl ester carboxylesterase